MVSSGLMIPGPMDLYRRSQKSKTTMSLGIQIPPSIHLYFALNYYIQCRLLDAKEKIVRLTDSFFCKMRCLCCKIGNLMIPWLSGKYTCLVIGWEGSMKLILGILQYWNFWFIFPFSIYLLIDRISCLASNSLCSWTWPRTSDPPVSQLLGLQKGATGSDQWIVICVCM